MQKTKIRFRREKYRWAVRVFFISYNGCKFQFNFYLVGIWGFKASAECLIPLTRLLIGAKAPSYESILTMDRKIRDIVPPAKDSQTQGDRTAISMRTFVRSHYQDLSKWKIIVNACHAYRDGEN